MERSHDGGSYGNPAIRASNFEIRHGIPLNWTAIANTTLANRLRPDAAAGCVFVLAGRPTAAVFAHQGDGAGGHLVRLLHGAVIGDGGRGVVVHGDVIDFDQSDTTQYLQQALLVSAAVAAPLPMTG